MILKPGQRWVTDKGWDISFVLEVENKIKDTPCWNTLLLKNKTHTLYDQIRFGEFTGGNFKYLRNQDSPK